LKEINEKIKKRLMLKEINENAHRAGKMFDEAIKQG
jgi:hypothetical protein